ncbi:MAG: protein kinase [Planctomycetes bacterium]|nr:protein kinase [Planctomycetota bacterium]
MAVQFACPNPQCQHPLSVSEQYVGQKVRCPACKTVVRVPGGAAPKPELEQVGVYKIVKRVGGGGMGSVYEAIHENLGRRVALKVLSKQMSENPTALARFQREAQAAAALNHPHIIQVYDIAAESGLHYFAMEFVDGETVLEKLKREGKISVPEALSIGDAVGKALQYAHERHFIHRDIKPENIMIDRDGRVKLADLGLAKSIEGGHDVTVPGVGLGTPYYMAPEQSTDAAQVDHRADIYALGVTLLHMMTGKRPFDGKTALRIIRAHMEQPLPSGKDLGTELPPGVDALLQKMCAKDREKRHGSYSELLEELTGVRSSVSPLPAPPAAVEAPGGEPKAEVAEGHAEGDAAAAERPAPADKAAALRSRARSRRRKSQEENRTWFYLLIGAVVLVAILLLWRMASKHS